ncbi:MAG: hypothetical protein K2W95_07145 [Candidatus Obscuribacterales bacterium]|nr:hypothetical protein [Candidatus Obscuribacterales bacterium]
MMWLYLSTDVDVEEQLLKAANECEQNAAAHYVLSVRRELDELALMFGKFLFISEEEPESLADIIDVLANELVSPTLDDVELPPEAWTPKFHLLLQRVLQFQRTTLPLLVYQDVEDIVRDDKDLQFALAILSVKFGYVVPAPLGALLAQALLDDTKSIARHQRAASTLLLDAQSVLTDELTRSFLSNKGINVQTVRGKGVAAQDITASYLGVGAEAIRGRKHRFGSRFIADRDHLNVLRAVYFGVDVKALWMHLMKEFAAYLPDSLQAESKLPSEEEYYRIPLEREQPYPVCAPYTVCAQPNCAVLLRGGGPNCQTCQQRIDAQCR